MSGMLTVGQTSFVTGTTKIAVPITGKTMDAITTQAQKAIVAQPDVVEWRIDYDQDLLDRDIYQATYTKLRPILGDTVLLTTFRTASEGGEADLEETTYVALYKWLIDHQLTDMLDIELHFSEAVISDLIYLAHQHNIKVILSAHEFQGTPPELEIISLLEQIQNHTMMRATATESEKLDIPIIAISMGNLGRISRITAPLFGSVLSFATVGDASAPGQIAIDDLRKEMAQFDIE